MQGFTGQPLVEAFGSIARAEDVLNKDSYAGTRAERVADAHTQLLRAVALGIAAGAAALEALAEQEANR